ncbi:unnamed protein product [Ostreobium quekettii]|uniref:Photosystem II PsbX n=1 Tax=Ostreobium quekettii TaxID=121088 RepID=A0A8S1JB11_9CHLO|nr:unnamed protein product [Ostreobium quekettii]|eukprot:evm.model.scf_2014.1 EVM.evm.TU.scf_2014.1   scf_2014:2992-4494(-)
MAAFASTNSPMIAARKGMKGLPVVQHPRPANARVARVVCASHQKDALLAAPALAAALTAALAAPEVADAATVNASVSALLNSVLAGGVVAGGIVGAVGLIANFDPVNRRR